MHDGELKNIRILINKRPVLVPSGCTVAVALTIIDEACRISVRQQERGPLCAMGICYECRVTIDGIPHRLACQTLCVADMDVQTSE